MGQVTRVIRLIVSNAVLLLACLVFSSGFFPYKPFLPGVATYGQLGHGHKAPIAPFDKVIFMVVDALRSDFVFSHNSGFDFTQSLIANGAAFPFTAHAAAPTVTMPRVKAITTGSIPSFLDMILNFAESDKSSSLATQDTWLAQMKSKSNGKLVMYGDDTWLKLFPDFFARADGTSSFFVSDYTEVDNNVTRHVPNELENPDWNVMIMHYLGMDHIGHKGGPRSVNMLPKQREMDGIVEQIYKALEAKSHLESTLFVLCGDHGMNDSGNHGGSAPGETSPALVFMSPKFKNISTGYHCPANDSSNFEFYNVVEQSDIAPTLAGLLGFPTPLNNIGIFIPQLLPMWSHTSEREQLLLGNALQMLNIVKATYAHPIYDNSASAINCDGSLSDSSTLACAWENVTRIFEDEDSRQAYPNRLIASLTQFCKTAQSILSSTASNYNDARLYNGIQIALAVTAVCFIAAWPELRLPKSFTGLFFVTAAIAYAIMMFSSSYVEEEQQFWYWIASAWMAVQFLKQYPPLVVLPLTAPLKSLALLRVLRRWNQSGQKWQGAADIAGLLQSLPLALLWPLVFLTFQKVGSELVSSSFAAAGFSPTAARFASLLLVGTTLCLKISHTLLHERWLLNGAETLVGWLDGASCVLQARLVFVWLSLSCTCAMVASFGGRGSATLAQMVSPLLTILLVAQNTILTCPVFLLSLYQMRSLRKMNLDQMSITMTTIIMAHSSFFAMGNTNAISSIDLSNAYNGITSFNPVPVGILLFVGNWSGPIFWSISGLVLILEKSMRQAATTASLTRMPSNPMSLTLTKPKTKMAKRETTLLGSGPLPNTESTQELAATHQKNAKSSQNQTSPRSAATKILHKQCTTQTPTQNPKSTPSPHQARQATETELDYQTAQAIQTEPDQPMAQTIHTKLDQQMAQTKQLEAENMAALKKTERHIAIDAWMTHVEILTLWAAIEILAVLAACTALKTHLFVWTVFSPKFLYVGAWFVGWHICFNLILGGILVLIQ